MGIFHAGVGVNVIEHVYRQLNIECLQVFGKIHQCRGGAIQMRPGKAGGSYLFIGQKSCTVGFHHFVPVDMRPTVIDTPVSELVTEKIEILPAIFCNHGRMNPVGGSPGEFVKTNAVKTETSQKMAPLYRLVGLHKGEITAKIGSPKSNRGSVFELQSISVDLYKTMFPCRLVEPVGHIGKGLRWISGGREDKPVALRLRRHGP